MKRFDEPDQPLQSFRPIAITLLMSTLGLALTFGALAKWG